MKVIRYQIDLEQPLLATAPIGDPNSGVSFDYVPGSLVRGLLVHRYKAERGLAADVDLVDDSDARRLFFAADTRYLHGYVVSTERERTLPTPRSFLRLKRANGAAGAVAHNAAHPECDAAARQQIEARAGDTLKPIGASFCTAGESGELRCYTPLRSIAVHVQRSRAKGRALAEQGAVFRYEALAAGQACQGVILCDTDSDAELLEKLLAAPHAWLGRSRSAGYGRVRLSLLETLDAADWREAEPTPRRAAPAWTLTLLSDTLLRGADGHGVTRLDNQLLSDYLGVEVTIDSARTFTDWTLAGGFNRTWQTPLAQSYALRAGSVIGFNPVASLSAAQIDQIEWQGLGERRAEGFGRVAVNWLQVPELTLKRVMVEPVVDAPLELSSPARKLAAQMAGRMFTQDIDQAIARYVRDRVTEAPGVIATMPSNSQLGRVRVLVRRALGSDAADTSAVRAQFEQYRAAAGVQFERARIAEQSLATWIVGLLSNPDQVWTMLAVVPPTVADTPALLDEAPRRARVVALRLLEAVLTAPARAVREEQLR